MNIPVGNCTNPLLAVIFVRMQSINGKCTIHSREGFAIPLTLLPGIGPGSQA